MMSSEHIIDVSEATFQQEVLSYSSSTPVVVDFWAEWCAPCRMLGPILEKLAQEAGGAFRLAKLDVDQNQSLAMQYRVTGIPAVKAFRNGQVVAEFTGALPEPQVREWLRKLAPTPHDLLLEKGASMLGLSKWGDAESAFRKILHADQDHPAALLGLAKSLITQGKAAEALAILRAFPASKEYAQAEQLLPLAMAMTEQQPQISEQEDELAAAYAHALRLVHIGNIPAAVDGLLDVLRQDKHYRQGEASKVVVGLIALLDENEETARTYRRELASVLF